MASDLIITKKLAGSSYHYIPFTGTTTYHRPFPLSPFDSRTLNLKSCKLLKLCLSVSMSNPVSASCGTLYSDNEVLRGDEEYGNFENTIVRKKRVFLLDVNPLCYQGSKPSLLYFANWISLFFSQVSLNHPVIAVLDGESGNEQRRKLLPSYKANRRKILQHVPMLKRFPRSIFRRSEKLVKDVLQKCNVPVLKIEGYEADDVVATLADQVLERGYRVAIASPDKDFKQLISEDVQIVLPVPEFERWSFYTLKHYVDQHNCDPRSDLSLRCILGDEIDGVPGIQNLVPGFGRKTALKLLKKHGSLDNLLNAAATRTVAKQYAQEALTNHADFLRRNYEILSLKRDVDVCFEEQWLSQRDSRNDSVILSKFLDDLSGTQFAK